MHTEIDHISIKICHPSKNSNEKNDWTEGKIIKHRKWKGAHTTKNHLREGIPLSCNVCNHSLRLIQLNECIEIVVVVPIES